jgi:hypothetical protein
VKRVPAATVPVVLVAILAVKLLVRAARAVQRLPELRKSLGRSAFDRTESTALPGAGRGPLALVLVRGQRGTLRLPAEQINLSRRELGLLLFRR